jgi:hypothetical protein
MSGRTLRHILVGALALAIGIPSIAAGSGEGRTLLPGKRNPSPNGSRAVTKETEIIANNGTYGTTNATGVATGLNADEVDGRDAADFSLAADFKTAVVNGNGGLLRGRGATAARHGHEHLRRHVRPRRLAVHLHRHADGRDQRADALGAGRRPARERPGRRRPEPTGSTCR